MDLKLLFYSYAYPPLAAPRSIQVSRLVKYSRHHIHVVCGESGFRIDPTIEGDFPGGRVNVTRYRNTRGVGFALHYFLKDPDQYRPWVKRASRAFSKMNNMERYDALVTFGNPMSDHLAGLYLKEKFSLPWAAHFSDPWVDNPYIKWNSFNRKINENLERKVVESADLLLFTSDESAHLVMKKYHDSLSDKVGTLPHAFDPARFHRRLPESSADKKVIRHIGNFYGLRSPLPLLQALQIIARDHTKVLQRFRFEFIGRLPEGVLSSREYISLPQGLVSFLPPVNYQESLNLMSCAGMLLIIDAPARHSVFLPSKLIEYTGSGTPVFGITPEGTSAELIRKLGGKIANPCDVKAIVEGLLEFMNHENYESAQVWGDNRVRQKYEVTTIVRDFDRMMDNLVVN